MTQANANVLDTLKERGNTHGRFSVNAMISQNLKNTVRCTPKYKELSPPHKEALDMILHKISRILAGNPNFSDHWHDIAGYAKLVEDYCSNVGEHK